MCCSAHKFVIFLFLNRIFNENNGKCYTLFLSCLLSFFLSFFRSSSLPRRNLSLALSPPSSLSLSWLWKIWMSLSVSLSVSLPPPSRSQLPLSRTPYSTDSNNTQVMSHEYVTWRMCDCVSAFETTHSYETWLIHTWHDSLIHDLTRSYVFMSHTWMSPVTHMYESCPTYEWVM